MKFLKIFSIVIASILLIAYLSFLFIVPNFVKLDEYTYKLNSETNVNQGLLIKAKNIKLSTTWNLSCGAKIGQINGYYMSGEKFAQVDNLNVTVSLPYLLLKKIKFDSISLDKIITHLDIYKDGTFELEQYIPTSDENNQNATTELPYNLSFSENMPNVMLKKYAITLKDVSTEKKYSLKGSDLKITDFNLNKKIRICSKGEMTLDKQKQFVYDVDLTSYIMPDFTAKTEEKEETERVNILDILQKLNKMNLTANLKTDLKLKGSIDDIKTYGNIDVSNLSVKVKGVQLPESNLSLNMDGNEVDILSTLYITSDEKAKVDGLFKYGKSQYIDLNVKTSRLQISNLFDIVNSILPIFGQSEVGGIKARGTLNANFNIKSDFKTINSNGYLNLNDGYVYSSLYKVALNNINADVDFSKNNVEIKKAGATFNTAPLTVTGVIDSNAYANLKIVADRIPLRAVLVALGQISVVKENNINSGTVTLNGIIKGKLDTIKPQINVSLDNINIYNRQNKASIVLNNAKVEAQTNSNKFKGIGVITGLGINVSGLPKISVPNSKLSFNEKDITLDNVYFNLNKSKIAILGKIKDYQTSKMNINITANGMLSATDIKSSLDKSLQQSIHAVGRLPIAITITGNDKVQYINGQLMANNSNHLSIIDISSLYGKTSLINMDMKIENNALKIDDISINSFSGSKSLTDNFKNNLSGASKVVIIKGLISNLSSKVQQISSLSISIPNQVTVSIPGYANSKVQIKGNLNVSGTTAKPMVTGMINIPYANIPTMKLSAKSISVNATKNLLDIYCSQVNLADSVLQIVLTMNNNINNGIYIKSMEFNASNLNVDTMLAMIANMPQSEIAPGTELPVTIVNGKSKIERLQSGTIVITNVLSDFNLNNNLFKLKNISTTAYGGKVVGNIDYNLKYSSSNISLQGRNLNAQSATYACTGVKDLMQGTLDFDAINLKTRGLSEQQIMQSLKGAVKFLVKDGQMGALGQLENLLYAENLMTNRLFKASLGAVVGAVKVQKTGQFKYIKGNITLANGYANLDSIKVSGSAMSMYIKGRYNILNNTAYIVILGRLSDEVVDVLGPIGTFSMNTLISSIPKFGTVTASMINQITENPSGENLSELPQLTPAQASTKVFKSIINGSVESTSSVKSFKWLSTPTAATQTTTTSSSSSSTVKTTTQQAMQTVKNTTTNAINKVMNIQTMQNNSTTQTSTPSSSTTTKNSNGVADFINNLPNLQ